MEVSVAVILLGGIVAMDTTSGPQSLISEPVVSSTLLGLLFGMVETGLVLGTIFQLLWLGYLPLGGRRFPDGAMGAFCGTASLLTANTIFSLTTITLNAGIIFAIIWGVVASHFGMRTTIIERNMKNHRFETLQAKFNTGTSYSILLFHFSGIGISFLRGAIVAIVFIPVGAIICGGVSLLPKTLVNSLVYTSTIIGGVIVAPAVFFWWFSGKKTMVYSGIIAGVLWTVLQTIIKN